ncbi:MAG: hypothetical protein GOU97_01290 [Nanoarchaeota archaeon]|nr:hypothetical protein [Nanoarchaeota archaeon]
MRGVGVDIKIARRVLNAILSADGWTWVRKISRETKLPKSTVSFYVNNYLEPYIEDLITDEQELQKFLRIRPIRIIPEMFDEARKIFRLRKEFFEEDNVDPKGAIKK